MIEKQNDAWVPASALRLEDEVLRSSLTSGPGVWPLSSFLARWPPTWRRYPDRDPEWAQELGRCRQSSACLPWS